MIVGERHRVEQLLEPGLIGLGEVVQHMAVDQILLAGVADPQADPPELLADMGFQAADTIMAAGSTAGKHDLVSLIRHINSNAAKR